MSIDTILPNPTTGEVDDIILHTWNIGPHHFEQEIFADGHTELFYMNRETNELFDCEFQTGESIPDEFRPYLNRANDMLLAWK